VDPKRWYRITAGKEEGENRQDGAGLAGPFAPARWWPQRLTVAADDPADDGAAMQADAHHDRASVGGLERRAQLLHLHGKARDVDGVLLKRLGLARDAARRRDEGVPDKWINQRSRKMKWAGKESDRREQY